MYAVVRTGGKQVRVSPGDAVRVEKLAGAVGERVTLGEVLLLGGNEGTDRVGTPLVPGASVVGTIMAQKRGPKITIFKMKRRKGYHKTIGHRQELTVVKIKEIKA